MIDWLKIMPDPDYPTEWPETWKEIRREHLMAELKGKTVYPGHEPVIQGGSPSIDYTVIGGHPVSAKNAHTDPLHDVSHVIGTSHALNDYRLEGLKLAYTALMPRIFGTKQPLLDDIKELYELAEYNVRFILNEDIKLEYLSKDEKIRKTINQYK